jgi:hypothetical protein
MATKCSIPCNAAALRTALQTRLFGDETYRRLPVIGGALVLGLISPATLLVAPAVTAIVLGAWCLVGIAVVLGQAWLEAATPARREMPAELARLVEANAARIHPPRLPELRDRAAALNLNQPNFDTWASRLLHDLREATGEAWRCPCRKRRLPLPLPM